ncbi:MAG: sodium-dependent transporter [Bdellovibrionales bacterium]
MGNRAHWSGRFAFILAAAGSAIGLGNLWKFPYVTGVNGGGAFVLLYLACIAAVGLPILIAEIYIGQNSQSNAVQSFEKLYKKGTAWRAPGFMGLIAAILILSFYSVVGGWVMDFEYRSIMMEFKSASGEEISKMLGGLFENPGRMAIWHTIFMGLTVGIVVGGVKDGLERWNKILMPTLFLILVILLVRSFYLEGFSDAVSFLFQPDFSKLTPASILEAVGHSFFTLSLGMGAMITYGSYLDKKENLLRTAVTVAFLDTFIALIAGLVIFSIVFTYGLEPGGGPGLMFQTLPGLFAQLPGGSYISIGFFFMVLFAALSSAVSILEVSVSYFSESKNLDRKKVAIVSGGIIYIMGYLPLLSFNHLSDVKVLGLNFFDLFDKISSSYLLPIGGMLISLFMGWKLSRKAVEKVVGGPGLAATGLLWLLRVVAPLAVLAVIINGII